MEEAVGRVRGVVRRTVERARAGEGTVRKLGPGSTQIHVENMKVNIWEPQNGQPVTSAPHNHTQGFTSTVLLGSILNERLTWREDLTGDWELYTMAHIDQRRRMVFTNTRRRVSTLRQAEVLGVGTIYHCPREEFHIATQPELTMTFLQLWGEPESVQYSLLPVGTDISIVERYAPTDELPAIWRQVDAALALAGI